MNRLIAIVCIIAVLCSSSAFAYKRDVPTKQEPSTEEESTQESVESQQAVQPQYPQYPKESGGRGLEITGIVLTAIGGAAAIAGSTIAVASDKHTTGAIVAGAGAALGLTGSLLIMFGSSSYYGLAPVVDPTSNTYGLSFGKNF